MKSTQRRGVFVSYSRKDERWLELLRSHLAPYVRRGDLNLWDDSKIQPGDLWQPEIQNAIERAAAFVLLLSADFLASEFIASKELPRVLEKAKGGGARVLSIVVRPCRLEAHPAIAAYQTINPPDKPLSRLRRPKAEDYVADAANAIVRLLGPSSDDDLDDAAAKSGDGDDAQLFEQMRSAAVLLSVLDALVAQDGTAPGYTVSDLMRVLKIRSRRVGFEAVQRLLVAGWIEKRREDNKHTRFSVTPKGARQWQLLGAASDGPLRRTR